MIRRRRCVLGKALPTILVRLPFFQPAAFVWCGNIVLKQSASFGHWRAQYWRHEIFIHLFTRAMRTSRPGGNRLLLVVAFFNMRIGTDYPAAAYKYFLRSSVRRHVEKWVCTSVEAPSSGYGYRAARRY